MNTLIAAPWFEALLESGGGFSFLAHADYRDPALKFALLILGFSVCGAIWVLSRTPERVEFLMNAQLFEIAALREGPAAAWGRLQSDESELEAPLSKKPCLLVVLVVGENTGSGKYARFVPLIEASKHVSNCYLEDGTGQCSISFDRAQLCRWKADYIKVTGPKSPPSREESEILSDLGISLSGEPWNERSFTFTEYLVPAGSSVLFAGTCERAVQSGKCAFHLASTEQRPAAIGPNQQSEIRRIVFLEKILMRGLVLIFIVFLTSALIGKIENDEFFSIFCAVSVIALVLMKTYRFFTAKSSA